MEWTIEEPKEAGFYWVWQGKGTRPVVVYAHEAPDGDIKLIGFGVSGYFEPKKSYRYFGPLDVPKL